MGQAHPFRIRLTHLLAAVFAVLLLGGPVSAQNFPAYTDVYIDDFADLLSSAEKADLRSQLIALYDDTGYEAVIVTMDTMRAYGHTGQIEPFATGLFNRWGVGNANTNTGVMLLVARDDRQMRIELGSGFPRAMDAQMQRIIDSRILPEFRSGRFNTGITAGVADLVKALRVQAGVAAPATLFERATNSLQDLSNTGLAVLAAIGAGILGLGTRLYQLWRRRRPRLCPVDGVRMDLMAEEQDDSQLKPGQTTEEKLGSVDYDVWHCPQCQHVTIEAYRRWFTRYGACRSCHFRTLEGTTTTLRTATTSETGLKRIDYHCHNCSTEYSVIRTIAKLSDSDSGRSSFGGGSSSGGGASGRW